MRRSIAETICGLAGGALGLAGLGVAFFAPLGTDAGSTCDSSGSCTNYSHAVSYAGMQGIGSVIPYLIVIGLPMLGVAVGATVHATRGSGVARGVLQFCALLLGVFTVLGALSVGIFLLPGTALAIAASVLSGRPRPENAPPGIGGLRSLEIACGVASGVLGTLALYLIVFGIPSCPANSAGGVTTATVYSSAGSTVTSPCATAYAHLGLAGVLPFLIAVVVPLLAVALGAAAHGLRRSRAGAVFLWLGTLALLGFGVLLTAGADALPTWVGQLPFAVVYLVPVAALAVAASALALVPAARPRPGPATT